MFAVHKEMLIAALLLLALTHLSEGALDSNELVKVWAEATSPTSLNITWSGSRIIAYRPRTIEVKEWFVVVSTSPTQHPVVSFTVVQWFRNTLLVDGLSPNKTYYVFLYCGETNERLNQQIAKPIHVTTPLKAKPTTTTPAITTTRKTTPVTIARSTENNKLLKKDRDRSAHTSASYTLTTVRMRYTSDPRRRRGSGESADRVQHTKERTSRRRERLPRPTRSRTREPLRPTRYPSESTLEPNKHEKTRKYILPREEVDPVSPAAPERNEEASSRSTVATTSINTSDSDALLEVVASQRKRMLWWIYLAGGSGLVLIVLLSALTLLCYRPWRKSQIVTLRKKSSSCSKSAASDSKTAVPNIAITDTAPRESYAQESHGPRYLSIQDLPEARRVVPSVISWGSEFDVLEGPAENIYSNTDGMTTVSSPTTGGTGKRLQLPPITLTVSRSTAERGMSGSKLKPQDKHDVYVNWN